MNSSDFSSLYDFYQKKEQKAIFQMRTNINNHFKDKLLGCIPIIIKPKPKQMATIKSRSRSLRYER